MMGTQPLLLAQWQTVCKALNLQDVENRTFNALLLRYKEAGRFYHNLAHIETLLELWSQYQQALTEPLKVFFAIWYHDAVYDPKSATNEADSADLMRIELARLGLKPEACEWIANCILATQQHEASENADMAYFLDFDLAILGQTPEVYVVYRNQIRQEYAHVEKALYKVGRAKVLTQLKNQKPVYKTPAFQFRFETQAQTNMQAELDWLVSW